MPDLSAYIDFAVDLHYDTVTKQLVLTDTSIYPVGVDSGITGIISVTQPDGITLSGSFASPDITYVSGALTTGIKSLRLANDGAPQRGSYTVTYTVRHASYSDTTLVKVFTIGYIRPVGSIAKSVDVFTPNISCLDATVYAQSGLSYYVNSYAWSATIVGVGLASSITDSFDVSYSGNYYDAEYNVTLSTVVIYSFSDYDYLQLFDKINASSDFNAYTPPTLTELRSMLDTFKNELDALVNNNFAYSIKLANYSKASILFEQLRDRGNNGLLSGLEYYVWDIVRLLNDGVMPSFTNTNSVIPSYVWSSLSDINIGNSDLTLTSDRSLTLNGFFFAIKSLTNTFFRLFSNGNLWIGNGTPSDTGKRLFVSGTVGVTDTTGASPILELTGNMGNLTVLQMVNSNAANGAGVGIRLHNNLGIRSQIYHTSSGSTFFGVDRLFIDNAIGTGGLELCSRIGNVDITTTTIGAANARLRVFNSGEVAVGTNPSSVPGSILNCQSTSGLFVPPVMSGVQAEAISTKPTGGICYINNGNGVTITSTGWWGWTGSTWNKLN